MVDERIKKAADILVNHSTRIDKGEHVKIYAGYDARPLALEISRLILKKGAYPLLDIKLPGYEYVFLKNASHKVLRTLPEISLYEIKHVDAVINILTPTNTRELSNINPERIATYRRAVQPIHKYVMNKKWVIFLYPTSAGAQNAGMSLEEFENFVFGACNLDWDKEARKMEKIRKIFQAGKQVHIIGKETDLRIDVKGRKFVSDDGRNNVPGGEIFTSPREKFTEGHIYYDYPAVWNGREVNDVKLTFKDGKVIKASAGEDGEFLKKMIKTDKGASYLGELGIGLNPGINRFTKEILFDEKIYATVHCALGQSYKQCKGTNESAIHWDMVKDLRKNSQIYIDDQLIFKNGKYLIK